MENDKKLKRGNDKHLFLPIALTLISGILSSLLWQLGLFFLPITAALLALIFLLENKGRRASFILSVVLCAFEFLVNGVYSLNCLGSVIVALIIFLCFKHRRAKSECAVYSSIIITAFFVISFILSAFYLTESFSLDAVKEFYSAELEAVKVKFIEIMMSTATESLVGYEELLNEESLSLLFDSSMNLMLAYFAVIGFVLSGIAFKIFCYGAKKADRDAKDEFNWSFTTNSTFAVFFYALIIASMFLNDPTSVIGMTVMNLYVIFMFVYFYVGCKFLIMIFERLTKKRILAILIVLGSVVVFSAFSFQLIAYAGAFMTVMSAKRNPEARN